MLCSCSVAQSCPTLRPYGLQNASLHCLALFPRAYSNSCLLSRWCYPTISSSVVLFSSCLQSFPASESFSVSCLFASGGQSTGASASESVLPMNIQLNALASFLCNSVLGRISGSEKEEILLLKHSKHVSISRPVSLAFALSTVMLLPKTPTWCISELPLHLYQNVTPWWKLYLNVSIFPPRESGSSTVDAASMKAEALPPGVPLKHFVGPTPASLFPTVIMGQIVQKPSHHRSCHCWSS